MPEASWITTHGVSSTDLVRALMIHESISIHRLREQWLLKRDLKLLNEAATVVSLHPLLWTRRTDNDCLILLFIYSNFFRR